MPHTYLAFDMFYPVPDVAPPPWRDAGHVTFGSLISAYKITDPVIASWSRILRGVPGSRLLLRNRRLDQAIQPRGYQGPVRRQWDRRRSG